jgi:hypothetical protein
MNVNLPELIKQSLEVALKRNTMVLLAGISVIVILISYLLPPNPAIIHLRPYLFITMTIGFAGILINWGWDADRAIANNKLRKQIKTYLFSPDLECLDILIGLLNKKTSAVVTWPWAAGVPQLLRAGIIEEPKEAMSNGMRAYLLTEITQRCIARHGKALLRAWSKAQNLKTGELNI